MPNVLFLDKALEQFRYWAHNDRKIMDKIDSILNDIERNGASKGIGKPERLKYSPGFGVGELIKNIAWFMRLKTAL